MKVEQGRQNAVGGYFEQRAKTKIGAPEGGAAVKEAIAALDQAAKGIGSISVIEREERRQRSGWRHPENRSGGVGAAVRGGAVKISVPPERQPIIGKSAVGVI